MYKDLDFKQTKDYNCGVFSLMYLLNENCIYVHDSEILEKELKTTNESGTHPLEIINYFKKNKIKYKIKENSNIFCLAVNLPAIVLYEYMKDSHYSVVKKMDEKYVYIFNVWTAKIQKLKIKEFEKKWFTKKYIKTKKWFLTITNS